MTKQECIHQIDALLSEYEAFMDDPLWVENDYYIDEDYTVIGHKHISEYKTNKAGKLLLKKDHVVTISGTVMQEGLDRDDCELSLANLFRNWQNKKKGQSK